MSFPRALPDWSSVMIRLLILTSVITYFGGEPRFLDLWSNTAAPWLSPLVLPLWFTSAIATPVWSYTRLVRKNSAGRASRSLIIDVICSFSWAAVYLGTLLYFALFTLWL